MHNFIIFCKSHRKDINRFKVLKETIDNFNEDKIPFYVVCPRVDKELFLSLKNGKEGYEYQVITDEEVLGIDKNHKQNWYSQQIVKLSFYKTNIAEHFLIIDSDCYFLRNFKKSDFMANENTPYINLDFGNINFITLLFVKEEKIEKDSEGRFVNDTDSFFGLKTKNAGILIPFVASSKVLKEMDIYLAKEKNMTFDDLIKSYPFEMMWYKSYLLKFKPISYEFSHPTFFHVHLQTQYKIYQYLGFTEKILSRNYIGIVLNNGWTKGNRFKSSIIGSFIRKIIQTHFILTHTRKYDTKFFHLKKYYIKLRCAFVLDKEKRKEKRADLKYKLK
ncbi:MAG: DUF6492 family protein [Rickettsiales bacterium]|nr:DUF6492 family protein [Rickettsiales bacterium]